MHQPISVSAVSPEALTEAGEVYRDLCLDYLRSAEPGRYADYVRSSIANRAALDRHLRAVAIYAPYIRSRDRVLDWGCRHAPDACLLRVLRPHVELHGCDIADEDFRTFHDFAGLTFRPLEHVSDLPFDDGTFDVVVSSGVLEHVARLDDSLAEIWRVLRNDGLLAITFLPNKTSVTENAGRALRRFQGHNRLFDRSHARDLLLRHGFVIEASGYHQVFPSFAKAVASRAWLDRLAEVSVRMNHTAERIPGVRAASANLYFVVRRADRM